MGELTHVDEQGRARMVDVGDKPATRRVAVAAARVTAKAEVLERIGKGDVPKGDVLAVARIAGIMAAKRTHELVPLCHPLRIDAVRVELEVAEGEVRIRAEVSALDRTGVEMEALTAASVAALTVYDMCKALDREMVIAEVLLLEKSGGRGGHFVRSR